MKQMKYPVLMAALRLLLGASMAFAVISTPVHATPVSRLTSPEIDPGLWIEGRIAFLKAVLQITNEQQPLWDRVAEAMRSHAGQVKASKLPKQGQAANALNILEHRAHLMSLRAKALEDFAVAFKPLYETFSAEQKATADALMRRWGHWRHF